MEKLKPRKYEIAENGELHFTLHFSGADGNWNETVKLVRAGDNWTPAYQGKTVAQLKTDGNGMDVTIQHQIGDKPTKIRLDYSEASDLAILLTEYAKSDQYAFKPLYTVHETTRTSQKQRLEKLRQAWKNIEPLMAAKKEKKSMFADPRVVFTIASLFFIAGSVMIIAATWMKPS